LWLDDTYSHYGGELYLKDWFNNPKVLFDPVIFNALLRHFITGTAQNFDENVADAVTSLTPNPSRNSKLIPISFRYITTCSNHHIKAGDWI